MEATARFNPAPTSSRILDVTPTPLHKFRGSNATRSTPTRIFEGWRGNGQRGVDRNAAERSAFALLRREFTFTRSVTPTWHISSSPSQVHGLDSYTQPMTSLVPDAASALARYAELGGRLQRMLTSEHQFILAEELHLSIRFDDGLWFHEHEELGIYAHGETVQLSMIDFSEQFEAAWQLYALETDDRLTEDAQALKQRLLALVTSAEPVT